MSLIGGPAPAFKAKTTQAVRAVFIIDPQAKVRAILYYPLSCGRNMEEIKRLITAMQKADKDNVVTPTNWQSDDDVIIPPPGSCGSAKERVEKKEAVFWKELAVTVDGFFNEVQIAPVTVEAAGKKLAFWNQDGRPVWAGRGDGAGRRDGSGGRNLQGRGRNKS